MASGKEVFGAIIKADDESSAVIKKIEGYYAGLGHEVDHVSEKIHHMGENVERVRGVHEHALGEMGEHVNVLKEHYAGLHENFAQIGESVTSLLPMFAALGAAASAEGMFELVEHTAEKYAELAHTAATIGTSARSLQVLQTAAKLADVNIEGMTKSAQHLNRVLADTMTGGNKNVAALFRQIHFHPAAFHNAEDAMLGLADAFEHTRESSMRGKMAFALFGKTGQDLVPFLSQGHKKVAEQLREANELVPDLTHYGEGMEKYNEHMKGLKAATEGFTDSLGAKLAPAFDPLIEKTKEYMVANSPWITDDIARGVTRAVKAFTDADWDKIGKNFEKVSMSAGDLAGDLHVAEYALEGIFGLMALRAPFKTLVRRGIADS